MTTTTDSTKTIKHPHWCWPNQCTARVDEDGCRVGQHYRYLHGFQTIYGPRIALHLVDDAVFADEKSMKVGLVTLAHEDDVPEHIRGTADEHDWRLEQGTWNWLEPEEARMLSRVLTSAASAWEAVQ